MKPAFLQIPSRSPWGAPAVSGTFLGVALGVVLLAWTYAPPSLAQSGEAAGAAEAEMSEASSSEASSSGAEASDDGGPFVETVDVNLVNVEVYVTDDDGERVTGLEKDDFVLEVDKTPVTITNFYAVEDGQPVGRTAERLATMERPELGAEPDAERELDRAVRQRLRPEQDLRPEEQKLHLIVYVDNFNLKPFSRNRVIRATRGFLRENLKPGDEVMLVSYDRSLKVRHPFTRDPNLIATALYELEDVTGHRVHYESDRRDLLDQVYEDQPGRSGSYGGGGVGQEGLHTVYGRVRQYAESINNDILFTIDALRDQVDTLAGLPGRKAVLYVSEGLPWTPGEDVFYALNDKFNDSSVLLDAHRFDLNRRYQRLVAQANANRVTFYTIDAQGLRTYSYMNAESSQIGGGANIDQIHISNMQNTLRFMAQETGGFAVLNTNNFSKPLDRIAEDFETYYSLGFPDTGSDGRYHRLKVRLKEERRGWEVRHREGYRAKPLSTRMAETTLAALHYGYERDDLPIELEQGRERRQEDGQYLVPLIVKIPIGDLTFLPREDAYRGRVRLYLAAKDTEGGVAEVQEVRVPIDIPKDQIEIARGQQYHYTLTLLMRPGRQAVSVVARDEIGAVYGVVTGGLRVGS